MNRPFKAEDIAQRAQQKLAMHLTDQQAQLLSVYAELLLKWNRIYNLTSIQKPEDVMDLHIVDSLSLVKYFDELAPGAQQVLDVGSGGGLPAIVLAVMRGDLNITMVDAVQKKVIFLRQCIAMMQLHNARAVHARIESIKDQMYDVVTSRAFAALQDMVQWTEAALKPQGVWLAMKGKYPQEEINALNKNIKVMHTQEVSMGDMNVQRWLLALKRE